MLSPIFDPMCNDFLKLETNESCFHDKKWKEIRRSVNGRTEGTYYGYRFIFPIAAEANANYSNTVQFNVVSVNFKILLEKINKMKFISGTSSCWQVNTKTY